MLLRCPFDSENDKRYSQRTVRQNGLADVLSWADGFAVRHEALLEFNGKVSEQLDVLRLLARELQQCASPIVILVQVRPHMIQHERQNELLDEAECVEIAVAPNLVQQNLLCAGEKIHRTCSRQRVGHERLPEIESLVTADNVFDSPVRFYRGCQSLLVVICG